MVIHVNHVTCLVKNAKDQEIKIVWSATEVFILKTTLSV